MTDRKLRVMMIGAHPDDCELRTGGIALKYRALGHTVRFVSATMGDAGHHAEGGGPLVRRRAEEARRAAESAGIELRVMDNPDSQLTADWNTRCKFIAAIRDFRPDLVFTHRPNDYHPDHRYTSLLVQDSSYAIIVPNVLPLIEPMKSRPIVMYMYDHFAKPCELTPDVVVGIDDVMERKVAMIDCHASQMYEWLPWADGQPHQAPSAAEERRVWLAAQMSRRDGRVADRFRGQLRQRYGPEAGEAIRCAEAFEISEYGARPANDQYSTYFPL